MGTSPFPLSYDTEEPGRWGITRKTRMVCKSAKKSDMDVGR